MDRAEIEKLADLAKLDLQAEAVDEIADRIGNVLGLVDQLKKADIEDVAPMAHPLDAEQILRPDLVTEKNEREAFQAIAPAVEQHLYLVPRVIE